MTTSRRGFFASFAGICAIPVAGVAKATGMVPRIPMPKAFENGQKLTAKDLNEQFGAIHRRLDEA